jgi:hypothetical protein
MDWLSPVNAGAPSALVLKEGDRVFCRSCDIPAFRFRWTPKAGDSNWPEAITTDDGMFVLDVEAEPDNPHILKCTKCKETVLFRLQNIPDAPLEMRPKD